MIFEVGISQTMTITPMMIMTTARTFPESPSPLTRAAVDRLSPRHLPEIEEIIGGTQEAQEEEG